MATNSLPVRQFGILLWKSYLIRKRHYCWTFLELVLPVFIASLSIIANSGGKGGTTIEDPIRYRPIPVGKNLRSYYTLLYTPVNEFTMSLMSKISEKVDCKGVESAEELDALVKSEIPFTISDSVEKLLLGLQENETIAGVIFHLPDPDGVNDGGGGGGTLDDTDTDTEFNQQPTLGGQIDLGNDTFLPQHFRYTLRVRDFELQSDPFPKKQDFGPFPNADHYIKKNFVAIQSLVNYAYLQMLAEHLYPDQEKIPFAIPELRDLRAQRYPYPKYIKHPRFKVSIISRFFAGTGKLNTLQLTMEYCTVLGFVVMIVLLIKGIVDEKVNRARQMLRLMGLSDFIYYSSCFANTFIVMVLQSALLTLMFCAGPDAQLKGASSSLVFVLLLLYSASSIMFAMAIAVFFKKPTNAMIIGFILWLSVQEVLGMLFEKRAGLTETSGLINVPEWWHLIFAAMVPNYALKVSNEMLVEAEVYAAYGSFVKQYSLYSAHWGNVLNILPLYRYLSILRVAGALLFSCLFYGFIVWYVDVYRVYKSQSNERYQGGEDESYDNPTFVDDGAESEESNRAKYFEAEPKNLRVGISAQNLRKEFAEKVAVKNVSLNVYHGQITVLLGHNGAGKTTFASMLTGLYQPTSGTLKVDGVDAISAPKIARRRMGLCPQYDVLYDELTCEEHLRLFAVVKNCPPKRVSTEVTHVLDQLGLSFKRCVLSKDLSGGMKRRLSLGMAMINNTKILILDEPTSGLDPEARRGVWDFLLSIRKERLIMLSTHWMEEADVLGDRIAIMSRGRVICCGSSVFLKRVYAGGYHLRIAKRADRFDTKSFTRFVQSHLPESKLENETANEIKFTIAAEDTGNLPGFFEKLENDKERLGVYSCGVNVASMDDVFLRVIELENTKTKSIEAVEASMNADLATLAVVRTSRANSVASIYKDGAPGGGGGGGLMPSKNGTPVSRRASEHLRPPNHLDVYNNNANGNVVGFNEKSYPQKALPKLQPGRELDMLKLKALLAKRVHDIKRNSKTVVPILGIAIGCIFAILGLIETTVNTTDRLPNWSMELDAYSAGYGPNGLKAIYFDYDRNATESFRSYYVREASSNHFKTVFLDDSRQLATALGIKSTVKSKWSGANAIAAASAAAYSPSATIPARNSTHANDRLLDISLRDLNAYREKWLVGASIEQYRSRTLYLAWYNGEAHHSLPLSVNYLYNALLKKLVALSNHSALASTGGGGSGGRFHPENFSISVSQTTFEHYNPHAAFLPFFGRVYNGIFFPFSVSFIAAFYVLFPTHERISKAKLLQLMTGLSTRMYWFSNFIFDYFIYFGYFVSMFILILIWDRVFDYGLYFANPLSTAAFMALFLSFGLAAIPFAYVASLIFRKPSTAFGILCLLSVITGIGMGVIATFFETILEEKSSQEVRALFYIGMWFARLSPVVSLILGTQKLFTLDSTRLICAQFQQSLRAILCGIYAASQRTNPELEELKILKPERCCDEVCGNECIFQHPFFWFNWLGVNDEIFMLLFDAVLYWSLLALLDNKRIREAINKQMRRFARGTRDAVRSRSSKSFKLERMGGSTFTDKDVLEERARAERILASKKSDNEALVVHNLTKIYPNGNFRAVDQLCFAVSKEQFFGLLGINGAGKTTTFRMLTGDLSTTRGNAFAGGYDLLSSMQQYQSQIGYCPQFDALLDRLNSFETLQLYGRLRGIPDHAIKLEVNRLIKKVDLQAHAQRMCRNYSGGNKRKLSLAMALIGAPPVVLLDEPTSGVDPVARRKMWVAISDIQYGSGSSIILSSHSMDECEALCDRIAIMAAGHFECIGSTQYLRTKFGQGFSLIIKLNPDIVAENDLYLDQVQHFIEDRLPSAVLRDIHQTLLFYHIPPESDVTWSSLFAVMEDAKQTLQLEDYQVGDTTLEQIFLSFAKKQPQERPKRKSLSDIAEIA